VGFTLSLRTVQQVDRRGDFIQKVLQRRAGFRTFFSEVDTLQSILTANLHIKTVEIGCRGRRKKNPERENMF
jgi:hypothetical protein